MKKIMVILFFIPLLLTAQSIEEENIWVPFHYFIGMWEGNETGKAGIGRGERKYEFIMNEMYLFAENVSRFEPQEKNPKGEVHEDWAFVSYDKIRNKFVLREFHIESYVNQYTLDSLSPDNKYFVFVSESSENAPPGMRARVTLKIEDENNFIETFELAFLGKEFSPWLKNYWKRKIDN
ncbi:MAG: hypothetical protein KAQ90_04155 [Melioribacteraceae bacterium]|nr:hypothetical protein [Melioribacteraceae bacterium]